MIITRIITTPTVFADDTAFSLPVNAVERSVRK